MPLSTVFSRGAYRLVFIENNAPARLSTTPLGPAA